MCVVPSLHVCCCVCVGGVWVCVGHGRTDAGWHKKLVLCSRLDRPQHYVEYQRIFNVLCQFCFIMADKQAHSLLLFEQRRVEGEGGAGGWYCSWAGVGFGQLEFMCGSNLKAFIFIFPTRNATEICRHSCVLLPFPSPPLLLPSPSIPVVGVFVLLFKASSCWVSNKR